MLLGNGLGIAQQVLSSCIVHDLLFLGFCSSLCLLFIAVAVVVVIIIMVMVIIMIFYLV